MKAQNDPLLENDYKRYHLNYWGQRGTRWMPSERWVQCGEATRKLIERPCYAGLDLSSTTDLSSLVLLFPDETDDTFDVLPFFWMPEDKVRPMELRDRVPYGEWVASGWITATPGEVVRHDAIQKQIAWAREMFDVRELAYDSWNAGEFTQQLIDDGLTCIPIRQGFQSLSAPTKRLMALVLEKRLRHGNHPVLNWNADCVETRDDGNDNIRPVKPDRKISNKRIDGIVALIMAVDRATRNENPAIAYDGVRSV